MFTQTELYRFLIKSNITVRSCHLPRKAESKRKRAGRRPDVENFTVYVIKNIWTLQQRSDSTLRFIAGWNLHQGRL